MIEAVVFDIGGVLFGKPMDEFSKVDVEYGLPAGTMASFIRGGDAWLEVEQGRQPIADFWQDVIATVEAEHGVRVDLARLEKMMWDCMGEPEPGMHELVHELKGAGYRLALCSNIYAERREWLHSIFPAGTIDAICDSSEVGLSKPGREIYAKTLSLLGDPPAGSVAFIDDFDENVATARELGFGAAILFEDVGQARRELASAGVRV